MWGNLGDRRDDVTSRGAWVPPVDIYETDAKEIVLKAELPGLRREDIDLTVENNTLTVRGERRADDGVREDRYHRRERVHGIFSRSFTLPNTVDGAHVKAEYRDGVLTVKLPLREEAKPRQIPVEAQG
ncbi:MAG: molecular chaperone [Acidobacteria bacterium]|nr:MAG: molecular chaperone [Acidobacteriota bacterium]